MVGEVITHSKTSFKEDLDDGVQLPLVPALNCTECRQSTGYDTGRGQVDLTCGQAHTLAAQ